MPERLVRVYGSEDWTRLTRAGTSNRCGRGAPASASEDDEELVMTWTRGSITRMRKVFMRAPAQVKADYHEAPVSCRTILWLEERTTVPKPRSIRKQHQLRRESALTDDNE